MGALHLRCSIMMHRTLKRLCILGCSRSADSASGTTFKLTSWNAITCNKTVTSDKPPMPTTVNLQLLLTARAPRVAFGYSGGCKSRANQPGRPVKPKIPLESQKKGVAYRTNRAHILGHRRFKASNRVGKCGQTGRPVVIQPNRFWTVCFWRYRTDLQLANDLQRRKYPVEASTRNATFIPAESGPDRPGGILFWTSRQRARWPTNCWQHCRTPIPVPCSLISPSCRWHKGRC